MDKGMYSTSMVCIDIGAFEAAQSKAAMVQALLVTVECLNMLTGVLPGAEGICILGC